MKTIVIYQTYVREELKQVK